MASLISDRRLYLTADRSTVVEEGDARQAWLLVGAGSEISADDVARYGLAHASGKILLPQTKRAPQPRPSSVVTKMAGPTENKMVESGQDKGASLDDRTE